MRQTAEFGTSGFAFPSKPTQSATRKTDRLVPNSAVEDARATPNTITRVDSNNRLAGLKNRVAQTVTGDASNTIATMKAGPITIHTTPLGKGSSFESSSPIYYSPMELASSTGAIPKPKESRTNAHDGIVIEKKKHRSKRT